MTMETLDYFAMPVSVVRSQSGDRPGRRLDVLLFDF
jgi:hypothetical protein